MNTIKHLFWIPLGALISFGTAFLFGDLIQLPMDLYYLIYFGIMIGFITWYVRTTEFEIKKWISHRLIWATIAGILIGFFMMRNVLSRPETVHLQGVMLWWGIFWRGLVYGMIDGLLLFAFPWVVTWRAFSGFEQTGTRKIGIAVLAWLFMLTITTSYHLGYRDFRSKKILQPNIGTTITAVPTLVTANPVSSAISHVFLHVTAVIHSPETELLLPPHRRKDINQTTLGKK